MAVKRPIPALGPGSLTFGDVGSLLDISCQVTACKITTDFDAEDDLPTLCGGVIKGSRSYTFTVEATAAQDLEKGGLIDWTWKNAGKEVPFTFTPLSGSAAAVKGRVVIDPVEFGGDVAKRNTSDFKFSCVGSPTFTPDTTDDSTEFTPPVVTA